MEAGRLVSPLCIFHANCADGFTAAWAVKRALGDVVDFYPGVHDQSPPDVTGRDLIFVDFAYKRPVMDMLFTQAKSILVLDHHRSTATDLSSFYVPRICQSYAEWLQLYTDVSSCQVHAVFDMERSGAQIAWDFFHPNHPRPKLVDYVGERDLWKFRLPATREVTSWIFSHEYTFDIWDYLDRTICDPDGLQRAIDLGGVLEQKHHKDVAELVLRTRRRMIIAGVDVPVANIPYTLSSDAGSLMAQGEPFAACYTDNPSGRVFSLRSADDGVDVSAVAAVYGGGGHEHSAGFQMPIGWEGDPR